MTYLVIFCKNCSWSVLLLAFKSSIISHFNCLFLQHIFCCCEDCIFFYQNQFVHLTFFLEFSYSDLWFFWNLHLFVAIFFFFFFGVMRADKLIWRVIISLLLQQISEFDLFTLDDIDSAFQVMTRLTYSQNHHLTGTHFQWWSMFTFWGLYMYIHSLLFFWVKWFGWKKKEFMG